MAPVSVVASLAGLDPVPWLLLDRRIAWRRLIPAGALTAAGTSLYGVASTIYMPPLFESYSQRYGLFGVTLALIGWLLCIALIVVASTAVATELDQAKDRGPAHPPRTGHRLGRSRCTSARERPAAG